MSFRPLARQIGLYPQVAGKITVTPIQQFPSPLEVIGLYQKTVRTVKAHVKKFPSPREVIGLYHGLMMLGNSSLVNFRPLSRNISLYQSLPSSIRSLGSPVSDPLRGI